MEMRLHDRVLKMKIKLALITEKLVEYGHESYAGYIYASIARLHTEMDAMKWGTEADNATHMENVVGYLEEIENVLLACKVSVKLPLEDSAINTITAIKTEVKELIRRKQFTRQLGY